MDFTQAIRERRERGVLRSLAVLEAYDASDAATRATLLQIAAKMLSDARVTGRLIALLACEQDQGQRQRILTHLAELDFRQVPRNSDCIAHEGMNGCPNGVKWNFSGTRCNFSAVRHG